MSKITDNVTTADFRFFHFVLVLRLLRPHDVFAKISDLSGKALTEISTCRIKNTVPAVLKLPGLKLFSVVVCLVLSHYTPCTAVSR